MQFIFYELGLRYLLYIFGKLSIAGPRVTGGLALVPFIIKKGVAQL